MVEQTLGFFSISTYNQAIFCSAAHSYSYLVNSAQTHFRERPMELSFIS